MGNNLKTKFFSLITVFFMLVSVALPVRAEETDPSFITEGTFEYQSNEGYGHELTDSFRFREDCFMRSSYLGCEHLALLSSQAAMASSSRYNPDDPVGADYSIGYQNIEGFLNAMDFEDIEHNRYYEQEKLENSCGAAAGHKTIRAFGKTYTLIAVMPRSAGYKEEWAGDFTVDDGYMHGGFKDGRDECLRFLKQYIQKHGIRGDLKFWIAGQSRGAAISNLIAGFLAGGGIAYFGDDVSVTPEDIYCYGISTPHHIKDGMDKNDELSVSASGSRSHPGQDGSEAETNDYSLYDTPGEAYYYTGGGTLDLGSPIYQCIRNYNNHADLITSVPPSSWGLNRYGVAFDITSDELKESMKSELNAMSPVLYERFLTADDADFARKTFNLSTLEIVDDTAPHTAVTMNDFIDQRLAGLLYAAPSNEIFAEAGEDSSSLQNALRHAGGIYSLVQPFPDGILKPNIADVIYPAAAAYLAYSSERVMAERNIATEEEAVKVVFLDLLEMLSGTQLSEQCTADDGFTSLMVFLDSSNVLKDYICNAVPASYGTVVVVLINSLFKTTAADLKEGIYFLFSALANGYTDADGKYVDAAEARQLFYDKALPFAQMLVPEYAPIFNALDKAPGSSLYGSKPFQELSEGICTVIKFNCDPDTDIPLGTAADTGLCAFMDKLINDDILSYARTTYGDQAANDLERHRDGIKNNMKELRKIVLYAALYVPDEPFSNASALACGTTFYANSSIIPMAHFNELSTAWLKAAVKAGRNCAHWIVHVPGKAASCEKAGIKEHWKYHDNGEDRFFTDRFLSEEIDNVTIPAKGHRWDDGVVTRAPTATEEGILTYTCKVCGATKTEPIPIRKDTVITCQDAGYPAGYAWNEAAKACQPGWLDNSGVFHPASGRVRAVNTYDPGVRNHAVSLLLSSFTAILSLLVLLRMKR